MHHEGVYSQPSTKVSKLANEVGVLLARLEVGTDSAPSASVRNDGVPLVPYHVSYFLHPASFRAFVSARCAV